jgi:predicted RNA binding protein YcfA (HicA-like mRNA interferase family)
VKVKDIISLIQADGWYLIKTEGGHRQYKHPEKSGRVTVPGKLSADVPKGTELNILRQAGLRHGN